MKWNHNETKVIVCEIQWMGSIYRCEKNSEEVKTSTRAFKLKIKMVLGVQKSMLEEA